MIKAAYHRFVSGRVKTQWHAIHVVVADVRFGGFDTGIRDLDEGLRGPT